MSNSKPIPGQRWVSDSEPELGLGIILKAEFGRVEVMFPAANEQRQYALKSAPLRRVQFKEGDRIKLHDGQSVVVESAEEKKGLLFYRAGSREVAEAELADSISFSKPEERLLVGQTDDLHLFDLRVEALHRRSQLRKSAVRGFVGGRVDLIPHQLFIAGEVAARLLPRVLLADEVGLGKTIEAGLILHRLHLTGRAERILILVPEPLIHQWFVELLRRFNLLFSLFDEERCASIEQHDPEANPFLDSQLVICSVGFLAENARRADQVRAAGWNLLVVDEAHHLEWSPAQASPQYALVRDLAANTAGVLLLTATPQQLGPEGHFARLRLLDPDRYADLSQFLEEAAHYEQVAMAIDRLISGDPLTAQDQQLFGRKSARIRRHCEALSAGDETARAQLVSELLDEFGTGRVMFRNTRSALSGFPERKALLIPLEAGADATALKVKWLAAFLKDLPDAKVLLICRTRELAEEIHQRLQREVNIACGLFHEGLTLLQRDRNAAFFSEEDGARILICSEIGSEGRNFQFAHHLVLFDLPANPELLEQRIGRLDRIGQTATIQIHVPYLRGTESEVLARWFHEGLNAFEKHPHGGTEIARLLGRELASLRESFDPKKLTAFIKRSREQHAKIAKKLERGHDRLLELNSCRPEQAAERIRQIRELDSDEKFEAFLIGILDHFGVHVEELAPRSYLLQPGHLRVEAFPALPEEGMSVTFDRARALSREDLGFLSSDHPLVRGALDLLLGEESGNAAFGVWKTPGQESVFLEILTVVECAAPAALHVDRFLPATAVRVVVDHALNDQTENAALQAAELEKGDIFRLLDRGAVKKKILPAMLEKAQALAAEKMTVIVEAVGAAIETQLQNEIERLEDLREINDHVRPDEIAAIRQQRTELRTAVASARLRLDALRLIFRIP
ncbi:MAG: ATP-dependent helicase HepA [Chthoniobacter sp.]|jgi:ATP-dependent helicase HepA|nr:ATP-dependent helicase HepA [Chthoniobacter sp.]